MVGDIVHQRRWYCQSVLIIIDRTGIWILLTKVTDMLSARSVHVSMPAVSYKPRSKTSNTDANNEESSEQSLSQFLGAFVCLLQIVFVGK